MMIFSPQELIGQKVWVSVQPESSYADIEPLRLQAEITQPTSPPWFYARYLNPPSFLRSTGQWLSLRDAEQAVLNDPVIEYDDYDEDLEDESEDDFGLYDHQRYR